MKITLEFDSWEELTAFRAAKSEPALAPAPAPAPTPKSEPTPAAKSEPAPTPAPEPEPARRGRGRPAKAAKPPETPAPKTAVSDSATLAELRGVLMEIRGLSSPEVPRRLVREIAGVEGMMDIPPAKYGELLAAARATLADLTAEEEGAGDDDPLAI